MKSNLDNTKLRILWAGICVAVLVAWTGIAQLLWAKRVVFPHGLPAFFLGVLVLILLVGAVRLGRGVWRGRMRWLLSKEAFRILGWMAIFVVTTVALFYAMELWSGRKAWANVVQEAKARGEPLTSELALPAAVPDEQNFAKAPIFAPIFTNVAVSAVWNPRRVEKYLIFSERRKLPYTNWHVKELPFLDQEKINLRAYAEYYEGKRLDDTDEAQAARLLLNAFTRYEGIFKELREYSARPYCRFPLLFHNPELAPPFHLATFRDLINLLGQRASAELVLGQAEAAFADVQLAVRLVDYYRQQASPIAGRGNLVLLALQPIWEGLASHAWNEQQLSKLEAELEGWNLVGYFQEEFRAGALYMAAFVESVVPTSRSPKPVVFDLEKADETGLRLLRLLYPVGWSLQDQAAIHRYHMQSAEALSYVQEGRRGLSKEEAKTLFSSSDPFFPVFVVPKVKELAQIAGRDYLISQTMVNEGKVACALERYRLAHQSYPETLGDLVTQYVASLPVDVINGEPLKYRRAAADRFVLYSVGLNRADDGGTPSPREVDWKGISRPAPNWSAGDWVWTYWRLNRQR